MLASDTMDAKNRKTSKRRLLKLADFLDTVPRDKFDMSSWASGVSSFDSKRKKLGECGTAACALGWATAIPSFKRQGLKLMSESGVTYVTRAGHADYSSEQTAEEFFFLAYKEVLMLFFNERDNPFGFATTPKEAAKRIRRFVKKFREDRV